MLRTRSVICRHSPRVSEPLPASGLLSKHWSRTSALVAAATVLSPAACSTTTSLNIAGDSIESGSLEMALAVDGLQVSSVGVRLTSPALANPRQRNIDVSDPRATISFAEHGLPAGVYDLVLTGVVVDDPETEVDEGEADCRGSASGIAVEAGKTTEVNDVVLVCSLDGGEVKLGGSILVNATVQVVVEQPCTDLVEEFYVGPLQVSVGSKIDLIALPVAGATATWSANGGSISADGKSFTCPSVAGQVRLRADFVRDSGCAQKVEEVVSCVRAPELRLGDAVPQLAPISPDSVNALYGLVFDEAGNFYTVGTYAEVAGADQQTAITKFLPNGAIDTSFGVAGVATLNIGLNANEVFRGIAIQKVGDQAYLVVAGTTQFNAAAPAPSNLEQDTALARFTLDGTLDTAFGAGGVVKFNLNTAIPNAAGTGLSGNESIWDLLATPDGKLVLHGTQRNPSQDATNTPLADADYVLVRLNADGSFDEAFSSDGKVTLDLGGAGGSGRTATLLPDGSIIGAGYTSGAPGVTTQNPVLYKVTPDGAFDSSFAVNDFWSAPGVWHDQAVPAPLRAEAYAAAPQGNFLVTMGYGPGSTGTTGSDFISFRFSADGDIDRTYGTSNGATYVDGEGRNDNGRTRVVVLPDNQIIGAGGGGRIPGADGVSNTDGMIVLLSEGGVPVEAFGPRGRRLYNLGGTSDFLHAAALSPDASQVVFVGQAGSGAALKGVVLRLSVLPQD